MRFRFRLRDGTQNGTQNGIAERKRNDAKRKRILENTETERKTEM